MAQNGDTSITSTDFVPVDADLAVVETLSEETILAEDGEEQDDDVQNGEGVRPD